LCLTAYLDHVVLEGNSLHDLLLLLIQNLLHDHRFLYCLIDIRLLTESFSCSNLSDRRESRSLMGSQHTLEE
jgi:hypothetical protein